MPRPQAVARPCAPRVACRRRKRDDATALWAGLPLGSDIEALVRAESSTTLNDMSHVRSLAAVAIVVLVAGCSQQGAVTGPTPRATALPGRFAPYVGPGEGWGGPTVSLYTPSWGGEG